MGVKRAVDLVLDIARHKSDETIYTYGPLIHNPQTVDVLRKRGIVPVNDIDEITDGIVIIRAHGISPEERQRLRERNLTIIDATCPKVARVQSIIKKHADRGYHVVIVGDREHPEVIGLNGYANGAASLVENEADVESIPSAAHRLCVVAQTTQSRERFEQIVTRVRDRFPNVSVFNTICDSTEKRQAEIRHLAAEMDAVVIVGGKNSANTCRLAEIAREYGTPTYHVETEEELDGFDVCRYRMIGVSAGASTPNWIISGVIDYLMHCHEEKSVKRMRTIYDIWVASVTTDAYSALGAACLAWVGTVMQAMSPSWVNMLIAATYVYGVHTINRLQDRYFGRIRGSFREKTYIEHKKMYYTVAVISLVASHVFAFLHGLMALGIVAVITALGLLYNIKIFPRSWRVKRLGDIPGSKNLFTALAWAVVSAGIPCVSKTPFITAQAIIAFFYVGSLVFIKSALSDMVDAQSDRIVGRETIPLVIGEDRMCLLIKIMSFMMAGLLVASVLAGTLPAFALVLLSSLFYIWICLSLYDRKDRLSSIVLEGVLTTNYFIAGISAGLWYVVAGGMGG